MEKFNVVIETYSGTVLEVYSIDAKTGKEASEKAKELYMSDMDIDAVSDGKAKFTVTIKGYCDVILAGYSVKAKTEDEAIEKAKELYMSDFDIYTISDEEAEEIRKEINADADDSDDDADDAE